MKITVDEIFRRAKKYRSRRDFYAHDGYCYHTAVKLGILEEVCAHLPRKTVSWDYKKLKELVGKYDTLKDFYTNEHKAYQAIRHYGWEKVLLARLKRKRKIFTRKR